jgi:histidinol-phosphate aminotransferase
VPNISSLSVYAALASLMDKEFHRFSREKNTEVRNWLNGEFDKMKMEYIPSVTSFTLFPIQQDTDVFQKEMLNQGIGIRTWKFAGRNWCRVSMGTPEEMGIFMDGLKSVFKA